MDSNDPNAPTWLDPWCVGPDDPTLLTTGFFTKPKPDTFVRELIIAAAIYIPGLGIPYIAIAFMPWTIHFKEASWAFYLLDSLWIPISINSWRTKWLKLTLTVLGQIALLWLLWITRW